MVIDILYKNRDTERVTRHSIRSLYKILLRQTEAFSMLRDEAKETKANRRAASKMKITTNLLFLQDIDQFQLPFERIHQF